MSKRHAWLWLWALGILLGLNARAHNPYEITGTASVLSNRFEVTAVFEYRAARLLTGRGWATNQVDETLEFAAMKSELESAAGKFFQLSTAGKILPLNSITAELGVENHITLTISYPAIGETPVTISAPGLSVLTDEGQYGVGMTVLDMVRKKVLGQHVFSSANPLAQATFGPSAETVPASKPENDSTARTIENKKPNHLSPSVLAEPKPAQKNPLLWPWFVAAAFGGLIAWRLSRPK